MELIVTDDGVVVCRSTREQAKALQSKGLIRAHRNLKRQLWYVQPGTDATQIKAELRPKVVMMPSFGSRTYRVERTESVPAGWYEHDFPICAGYRRAA